MGQQGLRRNWTPVKVPIINELLFGSADYRANILGREGNPTNNETENNPAANGSGEFTVRPANNAATVSNVLLVDPTDPRIVYVGSGDRMLRIDLTKLSDPYALVGYNNSNADGGLIQYNTTGPATTSVNHGVFDSKTGNAIPSADYLNLTVDPNNPFFSQSTVRTYGISQLNNQGFDATWHEFDRRADNVNNGDQDGDGFSRDDAGVDVGVYYGGTIMVDPNTGRNRLFFVGLDGVATQADDGTGEKYVNAIGTRTITNGIRNGNLQIMRLTHAAVQPSSLAAELADALFYVSSTSRGFPQSAKDILATGNTSWSTADSGQGGTDIRSILTVTATTGGIASR